MFSAVFLLVMNHAGNVAKTRLEALCYIPVSEMGWTVGQRLLICKMVKVKLFLCNPPSEAKYACCHLLLAVVNLSL